jgi:uncharacterized membrane protein
MPMKALPVTQPQGAPHKRLYIVPPTLRLPIAAGAGIAMGFLVPLHEVITRVLAGWNAAGLTYLALLLGMVVTAEADGIKRRAELDQRSRTIVLVLIVACSLAMMLAIVAQLSALSEAHGAYRTVKFTLAFTSILISWLVVHVVFGLFYAHEYHSSRRDKKAGSGLKFPGETSPDYFDFLYFAMVIGMTAQTSDVQITARRLRRAATLHGMLSFVFNTAVIALVVNLTAQLAG